MQKMQLKVVFFSKSIHHCWLFCWPVDRDNFAKELFGNRSRSVSPESPGYLNGRFTLAEH